MPSNDPLAGVAVFLMVVRARSFTRAAQRLGVSKSAVGKTVSRLEARLGTKLFYRTTRALSLTVDGEAFHATCAEAVDLIARAESALVSPSTKPSGRVRIDMPAAFGRRILLPVLLDIARPFADLHLSLNFTDRITDLVAEGTDLVIRFGAIPDQAGLVMRKLTVQRLCICASPGYLAEYGVPETLEDIGQHRCVVNFRRDAPFAWHVLVDGSIKRVTPPPTYEAGDGDAIVRMTLDGFGLCQLPTCLVAQHMASGRLIPALEAFAGVSVPVYAAWPRARHLVPRVRFIVDELTRRAARGELDAERDATPQVCSR